MRFRSRLRVFRANPTYARFDLFDFTQTSLAAHIQPKRLLPNRRSKRAADQDVVERVGAPAVHEEIERRDGPHQRVFETELVPEIAADAPALVIRDGEQD